MEAGLVAFVSTAALGEVDLHALLAVLVAEVTLSVRSTGATFDCQVSVRRFVSRVGESQREGARLVTLTVAVVEVAADLTNVNAVANRVHSVAVQAAFCPQAVLFKGDFALVPFGDLVVVASSISLSLDPLGDLVEVAVKRGAINLAGPAVKVFVL